MPEFPQVLPRDWQSLRDNRQLQEALASFTVAAAIWIAIMALTGWLASRRGRDDGLWAFVALFLGPIALVLVLLLPRRERAGPLDGTPATSPTYTGAWPMLASSAPVRPAERLLGALVAGALGVASGAVLRTLGGSESMEQLAVLGGCAGATVGYGLAGWLVDSGWTKVGGVGVAAGVLTLSMSGVVIGVTRIMEQLPTDPLGIVAAPLLVVTAISFPLVMLLSAPGVLAVAVIGGVMWAAMTHRLLRRRLSSDSVASPAAT